MTDIVERLRARITPFDVPGLAVEAATEIERLRNENRKMNATIANDAIEIFNKDTEIERLLADKAAISQTASDYLHEIERLQTQNAQLDAALKRAHDEIDRLTQEATE